jgi:putative hydrolase of the HAD superfamily
MKTKALLFDLGDTLIHYVGMDFLRGTKNVMTYVKDHKGVTPESVQERADALVKEISDLKEVHHFENDVFTFQKYVYESFGLEVDMTKEEQEYLFYETAFDRKPVDKMVSFLEYLKGKGIRMAILSNNTFSEKALRRELEEYGLLDYFEFVMSTAEYGIRKPDPRIFNVALKKLDLEKDEVCYVGNSFHYDVIGAQNAGLFPLWFNHQKKEALNDNDYFEFDDYDDLKHYLEK